MIHMTIQQLSSYLDAGLAPDSMERVGIHLSSCQECTRKFVALEEQANRISDALGHDPGDLLSDGFERAVDERILNGKLMTAPRATTVRKLPPLPESPPVAVPPAPALSSTTAPAREEGLALANAGTGMKRTARAVADSFQSLTAPRRRESDRSSGWPVAWAAALILLVIASGVGVVVSRTGLLPLLLDDLPPLPIASKSANGSSEPPDTAALIPSTGSATGDWAVEQGAPTSSPTWHEPALAEPQAATNPPPRSAAAPEPPTGSELLADDDLESPMEGSPKVVPGSDAGTSTAGTSTLRGDELLSSGSAPAAQPAPEATPSTVMPSSPMTPAEVARQASEKAATDPSASSYEAAARAWEGALGSLHGEAYQQGRWRIAEARYRAWQMDPDEGQRASRATAAIRAYLIAAPPGEEREQARTWLNSIRESGFR